MKKTVITVLFATIGIGAGTAIATLGWWNFLEPITGVATLFLAGGAMFNSWLTGRKLEAQTPQRRFEMTFLLREGYIKGAPEHSLADAEKAYAEWMQERIRAGQKFVTGLMDACVVTFPVGGKDVVQAPGVKLSGSLSPLYDKERPDFEVVETLKSLAEKIARELGQPRVYFSFNGVQYTVDTKSELAKSRKVVGTLKTGETVYEEEGSHLEDHPSVYAVLSEALGHVSANGRTTIVEEVDLGRRVGESICVATSNADEIVFARRPKRAGLTRFVKNRVPEPCSTVVVVLNKCADNAYSATTAYIGGRSPAEPWDSEWADEQSVPFWNSHALIWGEVEVVPGTETTECPW